MTQNNYHKQLLASEKSAYLALQEAIANNLPGIDALRRAWADLVSACDDNDLDVED